MAVHSKPVNRPAKQADTHAGGLGPAAVSSRPVLSDHVRPPMTPGGRGECSVFGRAVACVIVCAAAVAGPVARADGNSDQLAGARKALHRYFDLMDGGQVDVAVSYCHA